MLLLGHLFGAAVTPVSQAAPFEAGAGAVPGATSQLPPLGASATTSALLEAKSAVVPQPYQMSSRGTPWSHADQGLSCTWSPFAVCWVHSSPAFPSRTASAGLLSPRLFFQAQGHGAVSMA